ncbi:MULTISPECIES: hypothetical protein [Bacillus cereus group]|uniref:hypothetical protein n=1 Tax=Bacillus cereus group TaxID=86661 RepID=UPI0011CC27E4|nr:MULTISPECIES: hypothetical protein [Bacillus cereus group]QWG76920.1 hypothetical protein EXW27_04430 [Bacillus mycoides]TXR69631.1 hypothetical protein DN408_31575 [Bacillus sp. AR13-1]
MRTHIEIMGNIVNQVYSNALRISSTHHTEHDVKSLLKEIGSTIEVFLKEAVYKSRRNRGNFFELIDGLEELSVSSKSIHTLHQLRTSYNKAKHNPGTHITIMEAIRILTDVRLVLSEIKDLDIGVVNECKHEEYERVVWIAGWDHFTTSDTEISIIVPYEQDGTMAYIPTLDYFNIHWEGWDKITERFSSTNKLFMGQTYFPASTYEYISGMEDFIDAGVYTGDYRDLLIEISKHVDPIKEGALLPDLQRKNNASAMFYAVIYASCDAICEGKWSRSLEEMEKSVYRILEYRYAAPLDSPYLLKIVPEVVKGLKNLKASHASFIKGPKFLPKEKYNLLEKQAYINLKEMKILVTNEGELIVGM